MKKILLLLCALLSAPLALAESHAGLDHINRIIRNTPGVTTSATSSGAVATAAGDVLVQPSGLKIPVSASATIPKSAIARAAAGCASPIGALACAATAAEVLSELNKAGVGYHKCPPGSYDGYAFICKPDPLTDPNQAGYMWGKTRIYPSGSAYCSAEWSTAPAFVQTSLTEGYCKYSNSAHGEVAEWISRSTQCNPGFTPDGSGKCLYSGPPKPPVPAEAADVEPTLQDRLNADYDANRRLYDSMRKDQAAAESKGQAWPEPLNPLKPNTPITVTAPPVTEPKKTVSTEDYTGPSGDPMRKKVEQETTYTPKQSGTTVGDTKITIPSQTVTTTTITNLTTNTSNVTTNITNNAPLAPELEIPTDYAREETLKQVRDALSTEGAPTMDDQKTVVDQAADKGTTDLGKMRTDTENGIAADKDRFFSWVWTPPVGTCAPFAGQVGPYAISWDLCPTIENIRAVLGWLFALFAAIEVYGQLFKRYDA